MSPFKQAAPALIDAPPDTANWNEARVFDTAGFRHGLEGVDLRPLADQTPCSGRGVDVAL